jgi:tetratricopeptide (TPR) repeat protein
MGAGLGAIIGSQTGDALGGLALGAAAGAGSGAAIGNALQSQQEAIQTQDEAIERQQQIIRAQAAHIEELRRISQDNVQFGDSGQVEKTTIPGSQYGFPVAEKSLRVPAQLGRDWQNESKPIGTQVTRVIDTTETAVVPRFPNEEEAIAQQDLDQTSYPSEPRAMNNWSKVHASSQVPPVAHPQRDQKELVGALPTSQKAGSVSEECKAAEQEAQQAELVSDLADRLFHNRRALRLCPNNPQLHHSIATVYLEQGRVEDARFEFEEALRLDPSYQAAKVALKGMSRGEAVVY